MFGKNKKLKKKIKQLENQIQVMQTHILAQNKVEMSLKRKISELEKLLDIEQHKKIY